MLRRLRFWLSKVVRSKYRARGFDLVKQPNLGGFLASRPCDLVVDVGANVGQFGQSVREAGYRGAMISFEPIAAAFEDLKRVADWEVHQLAIGAEPGFADINVSEHSPFSSIKGLASHAAERYPEAQTARVERVTVSTLDEVLKDRSERQILLKIDTQGYEPEVLAGATKTLKRCIGVMMEVPVSNLYADTWGFAEAIAFMDRAGFVPVQIAPVSQDPLDKVKAIEFDVLFARKEAK